MKNQKKARAVERSIAAITDYAGTVDHNGVEWIVFLHDGFTADGLRKIADILDKANANKADETTNGSGGVGMANASTIEAAFLAQTIEDIVWEYNNGVPVGIKAIVFTNDTFLTLKAEGGGLIIPGINYRVQKQHLPQRFKTPDGYTIEHVGNDFYRLVNDRSRDETTNESEA